MQPRSGYRRVWKQVGRQERGSTVSSCGVQVHVPTGVLCTTRPEAVGFSPLGLCGMYVFSTWAMHFGCALSFPISDRDDEWDSPKRLHTRDATTAILERQAIKLCSNKDCPWLIDLEMKATFCVEYQYQSGQTSPSRHFCWSK
jgi:hypothetical protein